MAAGTLPDIGTKYGPCTDAGQDQLHAGLPGREVLVNDNGIVLTLE